MAAYKYAALLTAFIALPVADAQPAAFDSRGFLQSNARCDAPLNVVAFARTDSSLAAICVDPKGNEQYRGVRLGDGATTNLPAESIGPRDFVARNNGITYQLGAQKLVIMSGDTLIRRENVLEYHEARSFSAEVPPK